MSIKETSAEIIGYDETTDLTTVKVGYLLIDTGGKPASDAKIQVYDPDLVKVAGPVNGGTVTNLPDTTNPTWNYVEVQLEMDKTGFYWFLVSATDSHGDKGKAHQNKPALERGSTIEIEVTVPDCNIILAGSTDNDLSKVYLTATAKQMISGVDKPLPNGVPITFETDVGTFQESGTNIYSTTLFNSQASFHLLSSNTVETSIVSASVLGTSSASANIAFVPPDIILTKTANADGTTLVSAKLTHNDSPVQGHSVKWDIVEVYDANGNLVSDDGTYGSLSVASSTTGVNGIATTVYTPGTSEGTVVIQGADVSVNMQPNLLPEEQPPQWFQDLNPPATVPTPEHPAAIAIIGTKPRPTITITTPQCFSVFLKGCEVIIKCKVEGYQAGQIVSVYIWPPSANQPQWKADLTQPYKIVGTTAKFKYEWDTSGYERGWHAIIVKLLPAPGADPIAEDRRGVRVFQLQWPEVGHVESHFSSDHKGIDIHFSTKHQISGGPYPTENPIYAAEGGVTKLVAKDSIPSSNIGGTRVWIDHGKVKTSLKSSGEQGGRCWAKYEEHKVFTYYAHLDDIPNNIYNNGTPGVRVNQGTLIGWEDNTGNAVGTTSHLHFSLMVDRWGQYYENIKYHRNPEAWLPDRPTHKVSGKVTDTNGKPIVGTDGKPVRIDVDGGPGGHIYVQTTDGQYNCFLLPGTYTFNASAQGWTFTCVLTQPITMSGEVAGVDFTGTKQ